MRVRDRDVPFSVRDALRVCYRPSALAWAGLLIAVASCAPPAGGFQTRVFRAADGVKSAYSLFVPHGYGPEHPVPVILFLHGAGEAGTDGVRPTQVGIGPAIREREATFPFLVVFPQAQDRVPATF